MSSLLERLHAGEILISDGATGTYLQQRGLEPGGCPEEFNASHPEVVQAAAIPRRARLTTGPPMTKD